MENKNAIVFEPNTWYKAKKHWYSGLDLGWRLVAGKLYKTDSNCLLLMEDGNILDTPFEIKTGPSRYLEKATEDEIALFTSGYKPMGENLYLVPGGRVDKKEALSRINDNLQLACIPIGSLIVPPDMIQEWAQRVIEGKMDSNDFEYKGL